MLLNPLLHLSHANWEHSSLTTLISFKTCLNRDALMRTSCQLGKFPFTCRMTNSRCGMCFKVSRQNLQFMCGARWKTRWSSQSYPHSVQSPQVWSWAALEQMQHALLHRWQGHGRLAACSERFHKDIWWFCLWSVMLAHTGNHWCLIFRQQE